MSAFTRVKNALSLRRFLPKSLLWRTVLIVVAPIVIFQGVVASLIVERHFDGVTRQMTENLAAELSYVVEFADAAATPDLARSELERATRTLNVPLTLTVGATIPPSVDPLFFDVIGRAVEETLRERLRRPLYVAIDAEQKNVDIRTQTRFGVLRASIPKRRLVAANAHLLLTWSALTAVVLILVSLWYLRNQVRPIEALAAAAAAFGRGQSPPIRLAGALEVRSATAAFIDMRDRIERHIDQRTRMLSAVSHDMRTPLTRMKLALEMMEGAPEISELRHDVRDLEHILKEFLDYARGDHGETPVETDLCALAREVVADARRKGGAVSLFEQVETPEDTRLDVRPTAIKRCLHNLIDNSLTYGDRVDVSVIATRKAIDIVIEDDGPGIPEAERENAFRPFHRLDEARNQDRAGGVGLGLALALDAMRGHGGDLVLEDSDRLGGLRAVARLPR